MVKEKIYLKRVLQIALVFAFVAMICVGPVAAATSQGLEWGIQNGDQWNYNITSETAGTTTLNEVMYFEVLSRPTIPNIVSSWAQVPKPTWNITWANGTSLGWSALIFIFLGVATSSFAVPIGNFTLLGDLYTDSIYNGTIYDSGNYWGMDLSTTFFSEGLTVHVDYLRTDGMLAHWNVVTTNTTNSQTLGKIDMVRQGLPSGGIDIISLLQDNIVLVAAGVVVIVIIAAVVCRKK